MSNPYCQNDRLLNGLRALISEAEYSASSGVPFNAHGQEWTQLKLCKELVKEIELEQLESFSRKQ